MDEEVYGGMIGLQKQEMAMQQEMEAQEAELQQQEMEAQEVELQQQEMETQEVTLQQLALHPDLVKFIGFHFKQHPAVYVHLYDLLAELFHLG